MSRFASPLIALVLAACGGDDHTHHHYAAQPAEPLAAPAPDAAPAEPVVTKPMEGYQPDGTTTPPTYEPDMGNPISPPISIPCRAPQASEQGVAHGKPPVGRCV